MRSCSRSSSSAAKPSAAASPVQRTEDRRELVAADPRHDVGLAHADAQRMGELAQRLVARRVAVAVVELLEPVEVADHDVGVDAVARGQCPLVLQRRLERVPVRETRQRVEVRELGERVLRGA